MPLKTNMTTDTVFKTLEAAQKGEMRALSQLITLLESESVDDFPLKLALGKHLEKMPLNDVKIIGISGVPGAGKSTFIENMGTYLLDCHQDAHIAVLSIDPASKASGGSLLADKTRMQNLSGHARAFIRPSSNAGKTGGLHPSTPLTLALLKRLHFTHIFVETVGVGQSEVDLKAHVDAFCVLLEPGLGDDLQALKKGILDMADALIITKSDARPDLAKQTAALYGHRPVFLSGLKDNTLFKGIDAFFKDVRPKGDGLTPALKQTAINHLLKKIESDETFQKATKKVLHGEDVEIEMRVL